MRYEITFEPVKRWIRGEHQPTISYIMSGETLEQVKAEAVRCIRIEAPGKSYRFHMAREVEAQA